MITTNKQVRKFRRDPLVVHCSEQYHPASGTRRLLKFAQGLGQSLNTRLEALASKDDPAPAIDTVALAVVIWLSYEVGVGLVRLRGKDQPERQWGGEAC